MPAFDITRPTNSTELDSSRKSSVPFQVTNLTTRNRKVRLDVTVDDEGDRSIFSIEGTPERNFRPNGSQTVNVNLDAPLTTAPGTRQFRLKVVDVDAPDDYFGESQSVAFTVPEVPPVKVTLRGWWVIPIASILVGCYLVYKSSTVPNAPDETKSAFCALGINLIAGIAAILLSWGQTPRLVPKWWWLIPVGFALCIQYLVCTGTTHDPTVIAACTGIAIGVMVLSGRRELFGDGSVTVDLPNPPKIPKF